MSKSVKIKYLTPAVAIDGHSLSIRGSDDTASITFVQVIKENDDEILANGAASIRLSLAQLKELHSSIGETLTKHEEKKKKSKTKKKS